ncbi:hypothetical protein EOA85_20495 [Mesorhizobium sp. M5C.F.Ca.IN.020.29.1.1]|uniref:hypothetical protein n=1 Tax=unclassified Mesorhizobium TaxID=325217 RepID=UPI000FCA52FB|nr:MULTISPECIES: hypothetical protein [unclassified Mesorhizobium]RUV55772.1 hypothetical protein EOA85_20495 [Mesorhizobium sp. M5C.F.Ca.IN.020.29.1.1]TIM87314.1 MAG: hypothetical protein E5Y50_12640 [Mesorhizobium sp.]
MVNPFEKRATEYLQQDEAFLAVVTPEPLSTFFEKPAQEGRLYDRLAMVIGTPGSGKTTLARLFKFSTLRILLRNRGFETYKNLIDGLSACNAIKDGHPAVIGCRISLESEYREFWEFPYPDTLKASLTVALLQARAVLAWLRDAQAAGIALEDIEIVARPDADAALEAIGGTNGVGLQSRARAMETAIYEISAALVPPEIDEVEQDAAATAYRPLDVIDAFRVNDGNQSLQVTPLVVFDDAHYLHPSQLLALQRWLARRELRVARWILTRLDALAPSDVLIEGQNVFEEVEPGLKRAREVTTIWMQSSEGRANQRRAFRKMAKDMAGRYLSQMEVFNRRGLNTLGDLLSTHVDTLPPSKAEKLAKKVDATQRRYSITAERRANLEREVADYLDKAGENSDDLKLSILSILLERYANRTPQRGLFEDEPEVEGEPSRPLTAGSAVADGAKIHLLHQFDRPYYYGIDALCDASSENAEQFLHLAARLVAQSETQLIRSKSPTLSSQVQHNLLRARADEMIRGWDFPLHHLVRRLSKGIADQCIAKSLEGNASLNGGANAFGIPQEEFDQIPKQYPDLAKILQFGVAYNAFVLIPNHSAKNRNWCLVELSGVLLIRNGLTLKRGGFLERRVHDLVRLTEEAS